MPEEEQQCVFCHIASGKIPAKKVYEDDKVTAVLDINPGAPGHILLIPKQHVAIMPQMADDLTAHLGMVAKQLSYALIHALKVEGTSVFVANGVAAGQRAPHFLLHVIPRTQNDGVGLQLPVVKIEQKTSDMVFEKLGAAVAKQFGNHIPKMTKEHHNADAVPKPAPKEPAPKEPPGNLDEITRFLTGGK